MTTNRHAFVPGGSWDDRVGPQDDVCWRCGGGPDHAVHKNEDGTSVEENWDDYDERYKVR